MNRRPELRKRWRREHRYTIAFGEARAPFFSGEPNSSVVGATASLLLEVDEAQHVDPEKYTRDFRPMASSTNTTTVLCGNAWTDDSLLEVQKQPNLRLEQLNPDLPSHFEFDWTHGAAENDRYGTFVRAEVDRLGQSHPLIRTQYLLLPLKDAGAFFSKEDLDRLHGTHQCRRVPEPPDLAGSYYVSGIDVAGPSEVATDALLRATHPRKDSTVVTIAKVTRLEPDGSDPLVRIQDVYWWTGRPLHEQCDQLRHLLKTVWPCRKVAVDATGLGADLAAPLQLALGKDTVDPFVFTAPSKSRLSYHLLSLVSRSRLHMWSESNDSSPDVILSAAKNPSSSSPVLSTLSSEATEFWPECRLARPIHCSGGLLSFHVPDRLGHDDFLSSLALLAWCVQPETPQYATPLTPIQFIYPEPEDVNLLPFAPSGFW